MECHDVWIVQHVVIFETRSGQSGNTIFLSVLKAINTELTNTTKKTHFKIGCKTDLFALKLKDGFVNTSPLTFNYFEIVLMAYKTRAVIVFLLVRIPPLSDRNKIDDTHGHNTSNTILTTTLLPTKSCCFESVSYRKKYFSIDCTTM